MDYQQILDKIYEEVKPLIGKGKVADYIPVLGDVSPNQFAMAVSTVKGEEFMVGDAKKNFSIQIKLG